MIQTTAEIPWKMWVAHRCPGCGLTGEGRFLLIANGHKCPKCGSILTQVGAPFPLEGSDDGCSDGPPQTVRTERKHPIDIIDGVLRPLLGSHPGTTAAVSTWIALRRDGYLMDAPEVEIDGE